MGYRSDVRIVTSKKGYRELIKSISDYYKKNNVPKEYHFDLINNLDVNCENKFQKYFGWNSIKWYSYPDVNAIEEGLQRLEEKDLSYRFAKLGEDYDDYEEYYHDSNNEKEPVLEWPYVQRYFDDEEIIENIRKQDNIKRDEVER